MSCNEASFQAAIEDALGCALPPQASYFPRDFVRYKSDPNRRFKLENNLGNARRPP